MSLFPYQQRALELVQRRNGRAGLFLEMGTGKTRVALTYCQEEGFKKILVVCPISVAGVWEDEVRKMGLDFWVRNYTYSSINQRAQMIACDEEMRMQYPLLVLVNYESFWRMPLRMALQKWKPDIVILDEAHKIKGRTTRQAKFAHTLVSLVPHRLALTGTPITNGLQDLFSLYKFIDPTVFGTRYADFESTYILKGGYMGHQIIGYRWEDEVRYKVGQTSYQISKAEALDLPERTDVMVPVRLDAKTRRSYDQIRKYAIAEIEGKGDDGQPKRGVVLARIVLTTILRLQQVANGFSTTDDGEVIVISGEKLQACQDLVEGAAGQQVVIFCRFLKDIERLEATIPHSLSIHGSIPQKERSARIHAFQTGKVNALICQIQVASLGIDLSAASIGIFYSTGFSLTDFLQARDRIHRHGQTQKVTYYYLVGENTVEIKVYKALDAKQKIAAKVVDLDYARSLLS